MSATTTNFELVKPAKTDSLAVSVIDDDLDIIDTELAKPPLTVNETEPDEDRNITITTVPLADNLTSDIAQLNSGTFIIRASGGASSVESGSAWLSTIKGNQIKTGYVAEVLNMTVIPIEREEGVTPISATIDRDTFVEYVATSGTITLTYMTSWSADPELYGVTVTGTPEAGDQVVIEYVKGNRGTITTATPSAFISTGWNLYNHVSGYARCPYYSDEYGYMVGGTYTALKFSATLSGTQTDITPINGYFTIPSDGYVFVTGGNDTDTAIWGTWSDWTDEPNGGVWEAYTQTSVDLSGVMVNFPDGLMRIENVYDEINLNTSKAYSRIQKLAYNDTNLENVISLGLPYDTDTSYIYAVRQSPVSYNISLDGEYTANAHGTELFNGTTVAVEMSSLYGQDLKDKLRRDVLTISQQTLTDSEKKQVQINIGVSETIMKYNTAISIPASGSNTGEISFPGITDKHELIRWNFSSSAENFPPVGLSWQTGTDWIKITNLGGTTNETIKPVFAIPTLK